MVNKKVKALFRVKDKSPHQACSIYRDACLCGESYIDETIRNVEVRWEEHNNLLKKSNRSKHIKDNLGHIFNWLVLAIAPKNMFD